MLFFMMAGSKHWSVVYKGMIFTSRAILLKVNVCCVPIPVSKGRVTGNVVSEIGSCDEEGLLVHPKKSKPEERSKLKRVVFVLIVYAF